MTLVFRSPIILLAALTGLVALASFTGCSQQDQIAHYSVPKPETIHTEIKRPAGAPAMPFGMGGGVNRPPAGGGSEDLKFEMPEGWTETAGNQFSLKAFEVKDGDEKIDITVSAAGGDLTANMNRWRGQVNLPEATAEDLAKAYKPIEVNGQEGQFIEMHSAADAPQKQSILGVVVVDGDRTWFVKLRGNTALAERERANFEAFAKSLKW
ncbi:hypothetical protein ETAA8_70990 [Anatilimnocola aggregata]|uniref:Uncharacterized protein n=1 Tax=Anatilimnocola aggregata TaxID=2528021 RepID=A0A517YNY8_9BACT|nr:hypothetical protein [Anatilimnocola aggregata]QDU31937.1 hypothetical protein ETAA8_70990 [Anatilimnocola aggregata]